MGWEFRRSPPAFDWRTVRQRCLTSSLRLASPPRELLTLSCTRAMAPMRGLLIKRAFQIASASCGPRALGAVLSVVAEVTPLAEGRQVEQPASLRPLVVHVGGGQNHDRPGVFAEAVVVDPAPLATVPSPVEPYEPGA